MKLTIHNKRVFKNYFKNYPMTVFSFINSDLINEYRHDFGSLYVHLSRNTRRLNIAVRATICCKQSDHNIHYVYTVHINHIYIHIYHGRRNLW